MQCYLGFGIMRFQDTDGKIDYNNVKRTLDEYMKGDFCYFDVHPAYVMGMAQHIVKKYIVSRYPRGRYFIANKMPYYGIKEKHDYEKIFFDELKAVGVSYFDNYMLHAVTQEVYNMHERIGGFEFLRELKRKGLVRHIGISFHDSPEMLEKILHEHSEIEFVQLQINFFDWNSSTIKSKECYEIATKYNKKIIVMEPIKGGSLANEIYLDGEKLSSSKLAEYSLQFLKTLKNISVILSGMTNEDQVRQNRDTIEKNIKNIVNWDLYKKIKKEISSYNHIACTKCEYCKRECPKRISIPEIISLLNSCRNVGPNDTTAVGRHKIFYKGYINEESSAGSCIACGLCEKKCPQKLPIREYMKEAISLFEEPRGHYTVERNCQILIFLLKAHGIRKIVISPGTANVCFALSVQHDDYFDLYSAADERSACYIACGIAEESGEAVAISCTGATASRNYLPGLTEAYYRKLPILAITSSRPNEWVGHNLPQITDRSHPMPDVAQISVTLPIINSKDDEWNCEIKANEAILELFHNGGGPSHINLISQYSNDFSAKYLPKARIIKRIVDATHLPNLNHKKIAIFCGQHSSWSDKLTKNVDLFCEMFDAIVLCDLTSNYKGKYGVLAPLILKQEVIDIDYQFDLIIHIGNVSGAYIPICATEVWRVNPDGKIRDTFRKLSYIFEMTEELFFTSYILSDTHNIVSGNHQFESWSLIYQSFRSRIEYLELPFSNVWIASKTADKLPNNSTVHLGIMNSLRSWNNFNVPKDVHVYCNTGGFGIDGCISSLIGASLSRPELIHYCILGDLAMFYDLNSIGNRHLRSNIRIIVINNGEGVEFTLPHALAEPYSSETGEYVAAARHYGNQSRNLLRDFSINLGFEYIAVENKMEYEKALPILLDPSMRDKPILIEAFVNAYDDSQAVRNIYTLNGNKKDKIEKKDNKLTITKRMVKLLENNEVILWGAGQCLHRYIGDIEQYNTVNYVCDNDSNKWGKEISPGVICISPNELVNHQNAIIVITVENIEVSFQIASQLMEMGINNFEHIYNWLKYERKINEK